MIRLGETPGADDVERAFLEGTADVIVYGGALITTLVLGWVLMLGMKYLERGFAAAPGYSADEVDEQEGAWAGYYGSDEHYAADEAAAADRLERDRQDAYNESFWYDDEYRH